MGTKDIRKRTSLRGLALSPLEIRDLVHRANGLSMVDIAQKESLSEHTVKTRLLRVAHKLGVEGSTHCATLAMAAGIIKPWQIEPGLVPVQSLQEVNKSWTEKQEPRPDLEHNIKLGSSVALRVAELQLTEQGPGPDKKMRIRLSGWLTKPCLALFSIPEAVLTEAFLPGRFVPTGQRVKVRAVEQGDAYGVGVFVSLIWPKE